MSTPLPAAVDSERIRRLFDRQRDTALALRESTADQRRAKIRALRQALLDARPRIYQAGERDFRKPAAEVDLTEILPVVAEANAALRHLRRWMRPRRVLPTLMMFGTRAWTQAQPKGRCLIVSPWNYPINLSLGPLVSAIAAGNTAILKPSELTPQLSAVIADIVRQVFREDEVAVVEGGVEVSSALLELPFDHIFFTGSPAVGKIVMAAAARHLASVTLELGGKSPTIVDASADLRAAARNILWGKTTNNGQTCIAPDHVYVHAAVREAFIGHCREVLARAYGATPAEQLASPHLARIVDDRHTQRLKGLLDDATARGAKVVAGGAVDAAQRYIAPTLVTDIPQGARILEQEIFGPLLPLLPFSSIDQVIDDINARDKPLALYIWSRDEANVRALLTRTSSGGACINHSVVQFVHGRLPFGGVNHSGIGASHGVHGFRAFSHERPVVRNRFQLAWLFYPPYTALTRRVAALLLRLV